MAVRSLWKGQISFGLVQIPVGLVTATTHDDISFVQLDSEDYSRIGYRKYNQTTGQEVPADRIIKAYPLDDVMVPITSEEIEKALPDQTSLIDIFAFVEKDEIPITYYETPYFLVPTGKAPTKAKAYALLRETLRETGKVGLAKVVIRTRQHLAAVMPQDDVLLLQTMRYAHEIKTAEGLEVPGSDLDEIGVRPAELKMAKALVDQLQASFDPKEYRDDFRDAMMEYIEAKAKDGVKAKAPANPKDEQRGNVVDIFELLKKSVEGAGASAKSKSKPRRKSA